MQTVDKTYTTYDNGWIVRVRPSSLKKNSRLLLLIHGWTGDENSMWVFARNFSPQYTILAPRGPHETAESGFGWASESTFPTPLSVLAPAVDKLLLQVERWVNAYKIEQQPYDLMGFSQGAAVVLAIAALRPDVISRAACLAGYLPEGSKSLLEKNHLVGKPFYVAHGTQDQTVPLRYGQEIAETLRSSSAEVMYCETETGHKLGAACFKGLNEFFNDSAPVRTDQ